MSINRKYIKQSFFIFLIYLFVSSFIPFIPANTESLEEKLDPFPARYVFFLRNSPKSTCYSSLYQSDEKEFEFIKEPDLGKGKILRKMLTIGEYEKDYIPFAWNQTQLRLYIDFNRNLDLTDDPNNIFQGIKVKGYQSFKNIPIRVTISNEPYTYLVNLNLYEGKRFRGNIESHSSWHGTIDLPQFKARMSIWDNLDGILTLSNKSNPMRDSCSLYILDFKEHPTRFPAGSYNKLNSIAVTRNIHINDRSYEVQYDFFKQDESFDIRVIFEEKHPELGTIRLLGENIKEAILTGDYHVHLYSPSSEMKIPVGRYQEETILLQKPRSTVEMIARMKKRIKIERMKYTDFKTGGPLRNHIKVNHYRKHYLTLQHSVIGIGNEEYSRINQHDPPSLEIYQGEERILSDKFALG